MEELGFEGTDHQFMPIRKSQADALKAYGSFYLCVDKNELEVQGNFETLTSQAI